MYSGILIGYFGKQDEARKACKQLRRKGYRRAAWGNKSIDGKVHLRDAVARHRKLLEVHARLLVAGESILILEAAIEALRVPVAMLLESGETQPGMFILYPKRVNPTGEEWDLEPPASLTQLQEHARRLATSHRAALDLPKDTKLLKRIERTRRWVQEACLDLSVANRLEQSVPPTAEWLLDNEYIIESNARDVRLNLPRRYYRQLPSLTTEADRGMPRIYALARELVSRSDLRLDRENILAFIEAYQSEMPLSIGELWAVPQMLRTVLMEGIQQIAGRP